MSYGNLKVYIFAKIPSGEQGQKFIKKNYINNFTRKPKKRYIYKLARVRGKNSNKGFESSHLYKK